MDPFENFDAAPADELASLKKQIDEVRTRMAQMDDLKSGVANAVYLRVRADYDTRLHGLEDRSGPLRLAAQKAYATLSAELTRLEAEHEAMDLDRQEVEFRHQLGEFDVAERQRRLKAIEDKVASKAAILDSGRKLRERFMAAVKDESELLVTTVEPAAASSVSMATMEVQRPVLAPEVEAHVITGRLSIPDAPTGQLGAVPVMPPAVKPPPLPAAGTLVMPAVKVPKAASETMATGVVKLARLVPQNPEAGKQTTVLGVTITHIGADANNAVRIGGPGVDPRHAEIEPSTAGYVLRDHGSRHGTRVNAERVKERVLENEDVIQIGAARFVFRLG
jgi:FHA domain